MTLVSAELNQDLTGRFLRLRPPCRRFSCGGFQLSFPNYRCATVPKEAQMVPINIALMDGRLEDVTENIGEELDELGRKKSDRLGNECGEVKELGKEDLKVYVAKTPQGLYTLIPRDLAHQAEIEAYMAAHNGELPPPDPKEVKKNFTGLTPVIQARIEEPNIVLTDLD
jgi:hypothetical protein